MTRATIAGWAIATALILLVLALVAAYRVREPDVERAAAPSSGITTQAGPAVSEDHQGYRHGRLSMAN